MTPLRFAQQSTLQQIGEAVRPLLNQKLHGKVLAVFSNATYLLSSQGELVWLASEKIPMHRRCLQCSGSLPGWAVDSPYHVRDQRLIIGSDSSLDFHQATTWQSPPLPYGCAVPFSDLFERLSGTVSILEAWLPARGFGQLIPGILGIAQTEHSPRLPQELAATPGFAWPTIEAIAKACLAHDFSMILEQASSLIGLGEGLTPSGDDFIGGLLFCLHSLHNLYPATAWFELNELTDFIQKNKSNTNLISFTMLKDHADGQSVAPLHQFINALLGFQPLDNIIQPASELIQIGHSTGWEMLAGVITGMLLGCDKRL
jgi:hypothetical protein